MVGLAGPDWWLTDVVVLRGGGRDAKGNPQPAVEIPVTDCLVAPRLAEEVIDRSAAVRNTAALYRKPGFIFHPSDQIRVPDGARMAGLWSVDGRPNEWPHGVEVELVMA